MRRSKTLKNKLVIVSFTKRTDLVDEWLEEVIPEHDLDKVEFYIDSDRTLYEKLGFNWKVTLKCWELRVIKDYAKIHKSEAGSFVKTTEC